MMFAAWNPVDAVSQLGLMMLGVAILLLLYRLISGPTHSDRVLALDVIGIVLVGVFTLQAIANRSPDLIRVATVLALINFLGTVALAAYILRRAAR